MAEIEDLVIGSGVDLVMKLHETVGRTLGASAGEAMAVAFDDKLVQAKLRVFDVRKIPAIRGPLPPAVSGVTFRSDISGRSGLSADVLGTVSPVFADLLPGVIGGRQGIVLRRLDP